MTHALLYGLISFAFVTSITPGPNNLMLMASGANFGLGRTLPHALGVSLGHALMVALVGLGIAGVFQAWPAAQWGLKAVSVAYMLWLAWKIAHAAAPGSASGPARPMTFLQAAAFQWVNPKAWAMSLGAISAYGQGGSLAGIALVVLVFALVNLPSVSVWAYAGQRLRGILQNPARLALFNWTMAALLILSLAPVLKA